MFSQSEENYLKAIFSLQQKNDGGISTSSLADALNTKAASVTEMIKKLADKQLLDYQKYYGVELTKSGRKQALSVVRKHRLWETFLVDKLNFNWDEVHEIAEQLEHIRSPKLVEELDKFLGRPEFDPHGDPIPDINGKLAVVVKTRLSQLKAGDTGECSGVSDNSSAFLQFLAKQEIRLGSYIEVLHVENFDKSMTLRVNKKEIQLSKTATDNIYIKN